MKLWIDDVRPAPKGYVWCTTVSAAKFAIQGEEDYARTFPNDGYGIEILDIDHDAGSYVSIGTRLLCLSREYLALTSLLLAQQAKVSLLWLLI